MAYDRADWHYGGDYPKGLPPENGATHIGMFLGWAIKRGLVGDLHKEHSVEAVAAVRDGTQSGRDFLMEQCDEKFTDHDLSEEGNAFAKSYYESRYFDDYEACVGQGLPSLYHVEDSPENRAKVEALLDQRFATWRMPDSKAPGSRVTRRPGSKKRPWWRFW
ncbi:MAG: hypothetical protein JNL08_11340 [Planctomycetes bacterium]|nr:hypothetical protein [Planctomycetota bacterium]